MLMKTVKPRRTKAYKKELSLTCFDNWFIGTEDYPSDMLGFDEVWK